MSTDEDYRIVTLQIEEIRDKSIMISIKTMQGWQSIPRSLIYGGDDIKLDKLRHTRYPLEATIRILSWKADQLHLA